ncbi:hypothetical protein GQR58_005501 [Nymphon striatum]|nr:hypothetical protein GQR58_005501 [Nymphon striatum]
MLASNNNANNKLSKKEEIERKKNLQTRVKNKNQTGKPKTYERESDKTASHKKRSHTSNSKAVVYSDSNGLRRSTESIEFPPMDVIRSASKSRDNSDSDMDVAIFTESPRVKKKGKPPKLPILPPS